MSILSLWVKLETNMEVLFYIFITIGIIIIISSFIILINQYERAIILRLGKYNKQLNAGIQFRIPIIDNVLVIDIRERVRVQSRKNAYKRQYTGNYRCNS